MNKWLINFKVQRGRFELEADLQLYNRRIGIIGPSGHGKSTFLQTLLGHIPLTNYHHGKIQFNDNVLLNVKTNFILPPQNRYLSWSAQFFYLYPHMTVKKHLEFISNNKRKTEKIINDLDLNNLINHYPHQLSGGQAQLLSLARALSGEYTYLLLDEPFSYLDREKKERVKSYLNENVTNFMIVSHHHHDIEQLCDSIITIENGKIYNFI